MLNFAVYGNLLLEVTKESAKDLVNELMGCVAIPLGLTKGDNNEPFNIDAPTVTRYLKGERNIHELIMHRSKDKKVTDGAVEYFKKYIVSLIIPIMTADLIEQLSDTIAADDTISAKTKTGLLSLAEESTLADFLASAFLYVIAKPNDNGLIMKITENNNLPPRNKYFSGRTNQLESINDLFKKKSNNAVNICQTVSGLGGIGKTQLAIEYAYRYSGSFKNCIWFINAETATTTQSYFGAFAEHFKLSLPIDFKPEELQWAVKTWLTNNKNWLLVFDNLETADSITPYLPDKINGRMIVTTRNTGIDLGVQVSLGVFDADEALRFMQRRFSNDDSLKMEHYPFDDFVEKAPKLTARLGNLPLALEQAAAYMRKMKYRIADYLRLLGESSVEAFEDEDATAMYYERIVSDTWRISFEALSTSAKYMMNLCAYMAPDRIPVAFFVEMREKLPPPLREDLATELKANRVFGDLRTYSLADGDAYFINIHRLVQEVVRKSHDVENSEQRL